MAEFAVDYPALTEVWRRHSNYFVGVSVLDEDALLSLANRAAALELPHTVVREPDCGNEVTAVTLAPGDQAQRLCAQHPLALKEKVMT
jgi:hypothetical protein